MKKRKLTERQQIREWIVGDSLTDDLEYTLNEIFKMTMDYKKEHPNVPLRQAYSYAYITYMDEIIESRLKNGM